MYSTKKLYPIFFTKEELAELEGVIYDKSGILYLIAQELSNRNLEDSSTKAIARSVALEKLAGKVGFPLDEIYNNQEVKKEA